MAQSKFQHTFTKSKMNKDLDSRLLGRDEYRDGNNIAVSRSEADDVGALENILGNEIVSSLDIPAITASLNLGGDQRMYKEFPAQIIGGFLNEDTNKAYFFITNYQDNSSSKVSNFCPIGTRNSIVLYDTVSANTLEIVSGRFLNFSLNSPILDITMIENILYWTDNRNQPRCINVETAEANISYYKNEDHVSLAKYYPSKPIELNNILEFDQALLMTDAPDKTLFANQQHVFEAYYPFFLIKSKDASGDAINSDIISAIQGKVGLKGYYQSSTNETWDFTVAMVDDDYLVSSAAEINIPGSTANGYCAVYIDRDLSSADTPYSSGTANFNDKIRFIQPSAKDVSSPWLRESQTKLTVALVNSIGYQCAVLGAGLQPSHLLYKYGTAWKNKRSVGIPTTTYWNTLAQSSWPVAGQGITWGGNILRGSSYARVTHPKLDPLKYYIVRTIGDPELGGIFTLHELKLEANTSASVIPANLPLAVGDVLSIHMANPYWIDDFAGDEAFLEDKFVRFAYRFKYDDGQHSLISPFTQEVFIPKQKGYFLKTVGMKKSTGASVNEYKSQVQKAGEDTIVEFMENEVTQVSLKIPCEYDFSKINNELKVIEIDILYKESMSQNIMLVESLKVTDSSISNNNTRVLTYNYNSKEPIKTLRSAETTRVYDNIPVRAKTLSSAGNRIILGNFYDRHSAPGNLNYYVAAGRKFTPSTIPGPPSKYDPKDSLLPNKFSTISYPKHSLKQNRTYQVGLILQDRYGRSSDVILSKAEDQNIPLTTGVFANDNLIFGGSTIYHDYFNSIINPLTASNDITSTTNIESGIINWPGDNLKMLMTGFIPEEVADLRGYPGLYKNPYTTLTTTGQQFDYIQVATGGVADYIKPGMLVEWQESGETKQAYVFYVLNKFGGGSTNILYLRNDDGSSSSKPASGTSVTFYSFDKPNGWYSYKIVVKQKQQEYYNVYLPSVLDGLPVIKPFTLENAATFTSGSNQVVMTAVTGIEYLTFPLLEGMKVVTGGGNTYYIQNILNYTTFEITQNATSTESNVDFTCSTASSNGILNTTTLLTDNANKVPPALNETTPIQVQYSTSDTELIPRAAQVTNWTASSASPFFTTNNQPLPQFPKKQTLKVKAIGNYDDLFERGSYNGLYQADTNPPTAIIENVFSIGKDSDTALPTAEQEPIPAIYETTPTTSALDIYYESSTSGLISDLNNLIFKTLNVPSVFRTYNTTDVVESISVNESSDWSTSDLTIATLTIHDQNGNRYDYYNSSGKSQDIDLKDISVTKAFYRDGTPLSNGEIIDSILFEKFSATDANNRFLVKLNSNFSGYSSINEDINNITFIVNFSAALKNSLLPDGTNNSFIYEKYSLPLKINMLNTKPALNNDYVAYDGTVYYINNARAIDPVATTSVGISNPWNNNNGNSTTLSSATNGGNINNTANRANTQELILKLEVDLAAGSSFVPAESVPNLGLYLSDAGLNPGSVVLATTGKSLETKGNIRCRITAVDRNGKGLSTVVSDFIIRFKN